jgi:hypothetical protein
MDNKIQDVVFWDMTVHILVDGYLENGGSRFLQNLVPVYQRTWCHIPGDFYFDTQQCENVKCSAAVKLIPVGEPFNNKISLNRFYCFKNHWYFKSVLFSL